MESPDDLILNLRMSLAQVEREKAELNELNAAQADEISRLRQAFDTSDARGDKLQLEVYELEQEIADAKSELVVKGDLLARAGVMGEAAFDETQRRLAIEAVATAGPGEVVLPEGGLTARDRWILLAIILAGSGVFYLIWR